MKRNTLQSTGQEVQVIFRTKERRERKGGSERERENGEAWIDCRGGSWLETWSRPREKRLDGNQTAASVGG
jgi:hypothetical protein